MVVGTVYCNTCFHQKFSEASHFISGASVVVECGAKTTGPSFRQEIKTNKAGVFIVHLPLEIGRDINKITACSVKPVSSNDPFCAVASSNTSPALHLKSAKKGLHVFSAGFFSFKPLKQPTFCYQKSSTAGSSEFDSVKSLDLFLGIPDLSLPPLPQLPQLPPLPSLPKLPSLPSIGLPEETPNHNTPVDQKQTQPAFLPPPTGGGTPLPPNPLQPPPPLLPPFTNVPPVPFPTPLLSPRPQPPAFHFPFFPFPPTPLFPRLPPAVPSMPTSP